VASSKRGQRESLGVCTRGEEKHLNYASKHKHDDSKKDQVNEAICYLEESGLYSEYSEEEEEDEDEVKQKEKMRAIIVKEKFETFRVFEQRSTFWDALVKSIEGRMKPLNGEMLHLMNKLHGVLQQIHSLCRFKGKATEKHFNQIASYQKQYDTITARMVEIKNVYNDLNSRLEKYYKNCQDSLNQEMQYVHEIEELMPGRIDGDPERDILPHVEEDRKRWMIAQKLGALDEVIASFLGRNMTAEERDELLHSQTILMEHLQKFDCVAEFKFAKKTSVGK
jgi:type I restriction-modification system DNA methylase subunit